MRNVPVLRKLLLKIARVIYFSNFISEMSCKFGFQGKIVKSHITVDLGLSKKKIKPLKALFLSDLHFGKLIGKKVIKGLVEILKEKEYDILLFGGDFLFLDDCGIEQLNLFLQKISPPIESYAVFGNHDTTDIREKITPILNKNGVKVLINEEVVLKEPYNFIRVYGMDDIKYGSPEFNSSKTKKTIFLCHSPEGLSFVNVNKDDVCFAIFGHTHGGQIIFNKKNPFLPFKDKYSKEFPCGYFEKSRFSFPFYVSRGIGFVWIPARFLSSSEVVFIDFV
jgi:predicted MPP superfamily phosphohydrolase